MIEIIHRHTRAVLYRSADAADIRVAVVAAVKDRADLRGAYLGDAYLCGANLRGAYLRGACLGDANLGDANLIPGKTHINWQSHALMGEVLWRAAGENESRQMLAAYVARRTEWCWERWGQWEHAEKAWALTELSRWICEGDEVPQIVLDAAEVTP